MVEKKSKFLQNSENQVVFFLHLRLLIVFSLKKSENVRKIEPWQGRLL